jgi:hypothetical protein
MKFITFFVVATASLASAFPSSMTRDEEDAIFSGAMTWYGQEGGLGISPGACGEINYPDQFIVAMNQEQYGEHANPNMAPICHQRILIHYGGKSVEAEVTDKCPADDPCGYGGIDVSPAVFEALDENWEAVGTVGVDWHFI